MSLQITIILQLFQMLNPIWKNMGFCWMSTLIDWENPELGIADKKKHSMFCSVESLCSHDLFALRWCSLLFCSCPSAMTSDDFTESWILSISPTINDPIFFLYLPIMDFGSTLLFLLLLPLLPLLLLVFLSPNFSLPFPSYKVWHWYTHSLFIRLSSW